MNPVFLTSYVLLWLMTLALFASMLLLFRQYGKLLVRTPEARSDQGPLLGTRVKTYDVVDDRNTAFTLGAASAKPRVLFFASGKCTGCARVRGALMKQIRETAHSLEWVIVFHGQHDEASEYAADADDLVRIVSQPRWRLGAHLRVHSLPYFLGVSTDGIVQVAGISPYATTIQQMVTALEAVDSRGTDAASHLEGGKRLVTGDVSSRSKSDHHSQVLQ